MRMNISERLTKLETKIKYIEKTMYFILAAVLLDLGIAVI